MISKLMVLPTPKQVTGFDEGGNFAAVPVSACIYTEKTDWQPLLEVFCDYTKKLHNISFSNTPGGIELLFDEALDGSHYRIDSMGETVQVFASDCSGVSSALATLLQLITDGQMPKLTIYDYPDRDYRGFMVDLARQWHPFRQVLSYVDLCFLYKINYLHLHFFDNQSYTLPSEAYPLLPTADRHYTQEEIAYLVEYAKKRNITLVPEFEAPGHATALLEAYPELFACREGEGRHNSLICAGKEHVFDHLDRLLGEVCRMFPNSPYIHIGGDEAQIEHWNDCPDCQAYMKAHGIATVKELYTEFVRKLTRMTCFYGRKPIVWEGFPKEGTDRISRDTVVVAWENFYHYAMDLVDEGFTVINAAWEPLYITPDRFWTPTDILAWDIFTFRNWNSKSIAHLNPIHLQPTQQVWGAELCAWEGSYQQVIGHVKENLPAFVERVWTVQRVLEDEEFFQRLNALTPLTEALIV